jgi:hypothetical protein
VRLRAKRDAVESDIVQALRASGCSVAFVSGKDVPDLLIGLRGRNVVAEVKTGKAKLRPGRRHGPTRGAVKSRWFCAASTMRWRW